MEKQSSSNEVATVLANLNDDDMVDIVLSVPTIKKEPATKKLDITTLTAATANSLRTEDAFMYYSVFKPTGHPDTELEDLMVMLQNGDVPASTAIFERKTRISVECDALTMFTDDELQGAAGDGEDVSYEEALFHQ
jgi:hypothetical protein